MRFKSILILAGLLFLSLSCEKEEEQDDQNNNPNPTSYGYIQGEEGSDLTMEYPDGSTESIGTDFFVGWNGGQLLGGNYFRQLRIGSDEGTIDFRLSIPQDTSFQDIVEDTHPLEPRLLLQNTQNLDRVVAELWIGGSSGKYPDNATGTVTIETSVTHDGNNYDVVGEINATLQSSAGSHKITGHFWSNDAK